MCDNSSDHNAGIINLLYGRNSGRRRTSTPRDGYVEIRPGTDISHYRIESLIGSGSNGEIYLAEDLQLGRKVAIKILKYQADQDAEKHQAFMKEARTAASLNHPNIVTIYEIGLFERTPFIVMELVDGQTLDSLAEDRSVSEAEIVRIIIQVCKGLSAAHNSGFVHRDIKLSNVILDRRGDVKILDFGLATALLALPGNEEQPLEGTIRYMAPEILIGKPASPRSDLFSVGAMFYHLLTGKPAFSGQYEAAVKYSVMNEVPPPASTIKRTISPELDSILNKLLQKDPANRYQSADDLIDDLQADFVDSSKINPINKLYSTIGGRLFIGSVLAVVISASIFLWERGLSGFHDNSPDVVSLAVLPFENLGDSADSYFADGISEEVTHCLARQDELKVISRRSAMLYKQSKMSMGEIGRELNVSYFVVGTVHRQRQAGDSIKISAALISVEDDAYLWSESYFRNSDNIFAVESEIAAMVSEALQVSIAIDRPRWRLAPTTDLKAYDYYLRGNEYFNRSWTRSDIETASELYAKATRLDSTFASAWAMLSRARASMYWEYYDHTDGNYSAAFEAAKKAIDLRPDLPEGYTALGYYYYHCEREFEKALRQFRHGLRIDKNNSELHNAVAAILRRQARLEESLVSFMTALELDPRSHLKSFDVALTYGMMRQYADSREYIERTVTIAPDYSLGHIYRAWLPIFENGDIKLAGELLSDAMERTDLTDSKYYWWLRRFVGDSSSRPIALTAGADSVAYYLYRMRTFRRDGDYQAEKIYADSARTILAGKLEDYPSDAHYLSSYGLAMSGLGDADSALFYAQNAVDLLPSTREAFDAPFLLLNLAEVQILFDQYDQAIERLNQVLSIPGFASAAYLRVDPMWEPLHGHPRFLEIAGHQNQSDSAKVIP